MIKSKWTRKTAILLAAALTASGIPVSRAQVVYADDLPDHLIINQVYEGGRKGEYGQLHEAAQQPGEGTTTPTTPGSGDSSTKPAETETKTETVTNTAGKDVEQTTTTKVDKDGNVTGSTVESVIAKADSKTSVTVKAEKDAKGKTISAMAEASVSGTGSKNGVKGSLSAAVVSQITEAAGTKAVTITATVSAADKTYTIKTDAKTLTSGTKLRVMELDSKTGEYVLVNGTTYKVSNSGNITMTLPAGKGYELLKDTV